MRTQPTSKVNARTVQNVKMNPVKKSTLFLLNVFLVAGFVVTLVPAADAGSREVCHYVDDGYPASENKFVLTVEKNYDHVTGNFEVSFRADGRSFGNWMQSIGPYWGFYVISGYSYKTTVERNRVDLYLHDSFGLAYLYVYPTEYFVNFNGSHFWISLTSDDPLVDKWMNLHLYSCWHN